MNHIDITWDVRARQIEKLCEFLRMPEHYHMLWDSIEKVLRIFDRIMKLPLLPASHRNWYAASKKWPTCRSRMAAERNSMTTIIFARWNCAATRGTRWNTRNRWPMMRTSDARKKWHYKQIKRLLWEILSVHSWPDMMEPIFDSFYAAESETELQDLADRLFIYMSVQQDYRRWESFKRSLLYITVSHTSIHHTYIEHHHWA